MISANRVITQEMIFEKISSLLIFETYCENFTQIGRNFCSEFRPDVHPSCNIDIVNGDYMYKDFGSGESYRAIYFVMAKFKIDYTEALNKIWKDLIDGKEGVYSSNVNNHNVNSSIIGDDIDLRNTRPTIIKIRKKVDSSGEIYYSERELEYWNRYYWTEEMLKSSRTYSITHFWLNNKKTNFKDQIFYVNNELCFSYDYYFHNGVFQRKIYFPERKEYKWFSNVDNSIVQLVDVAPKRGDALFITSSKKDAGVLWHINMDKIFTDKIIHSVAPNNEHSFLPEEWLVKARERWSKIVIMYDSDISGITGAKKFSEQYNLPYYHTPIGGEKDPSDFVWKNGIDEFIKLIKPIIYE